MPTLAARRLVDRLDQFLIWDFVNGSAIVADDFHGRLLFEAQTKRGSESYTPSGFSPLASVVMYSVLNSKTSRKREIYERTPGQECRDTQGLLTF